MIEQNLGNCLRLRISGRWETCTSIEQPTRALLRGGKIFRDGFLGAAASQGAAGLRRFGAGSYGKRQHAPGKAAPQW